MARKRRSGKLSGGGKLKKWLRMVGLLTFKKYGARILKHLFFAYLLAAMIKAMHSIWAEFADFKNCQDHYIGGIARNVSIEYSQAAEALAESVLARAKCVMTALDLDLPAPFPDIPLGSLPKGLIGNIFGWFTPGHIDVPEVELNVTSNTEEVVESINDDIDIFRWVNIMVRYAGFILAFFSFIMILFTATYYTLFNKTWKPSTKSHILRLVSFTQVVGGFVVGSAVIFLQAYATNKFCQISIDKAELKTPECSVIDRDCNFYCELHSTLYPSPCKKCVIRLHWWWIEPFSMPNVFCAAYIVFTFVVLVFECFEAGWQRKELARAKRLEREDRRRKRVKYEAKKLRLKEQLMDSDMRDSSELLPVDEADVDVAMVPNTVDGLPASDSAPPRRRKKKSRKPKEPYEQQDVPGNLDPPAASSKQDSIYHYPDVV
ncbi:hypothetical protein BSKO_09005 [Bryopsis sp. KO-2023]|nr:hypothetical protein BSKO_09005 [Bryopsis sp. KO-2023]